MTWSGHIRKRAVSTKTTNENEYSRNSTNINRIAYQKCMGRASNRATRLHSRAEALVLLMQDLADEAGDLSLMLADNELADNLFEQANGYSASSIPELAKWLDSPDGRAATVAYRTRQRSRRRRND
jgi:hypothetical protein